MDSPNPNQDKTQSRSSSSPSASPSSLTGNSPYKEHEQAYQGQILAPNQVLGDVSLSESESSASSSEEEEKNLEMNEEEMENDKHQEEKRVGKGQHEEPMEMDEMNENDDGLFTHGDDEEEIMKKGIDEGSREEEEAHAQQQHATYTEDEEEEEAEVSPTQINLDIARCKADFGEEGPLFVKMPNFLSVETKPFDPETYDDELEEDEVLDEEGRIRLKLKMENTIRWRTVHDEQKNEKRESNAKIVRWSDGSMSLYLGKEIFEIERQRIMDHNHLYIRQGSALQAQSVFGEKLVFRPHSTETMTHRKMTMNMAEKTSKTQKVKIMAMVGDNPETERKDLVRLEEEKLRAVARREAQQRRIRERPRMTGLTSGFLEGYDSDEGGESLAAIKNRYQHAPYTRIDQRERSVVGGWSDEDEEDQREERRTKKAISEAKIDSEEEEGGVDDDSDKEERHKQLKKKIVIEEDEE